MKIYLNAKQIKIILARKNKSLGWLADRMDISQTYLSMLIKHEKSPRPEKRERLQKIFGGKSWDDLFEIATTTASELGGNNEL